MNNYNLAIYTDHFLDDPEMCKTGHCIIRFCEDRLVSVIDDKFSGTDLRRFFPNLKKEIPITDSLTALDPRTDALVIAFAPVQTVIANNDVFSSQVDPKTAYILMVYYLLSCDL